MSQVPPSTILIVEDTEEYRYLLNLTTKNMGHDCIFVEDGQEALAYLSENVPDLVLLDINMPRVSGITVLQEIRSNPKFKNVPVIMISAQEEIDIVVKCLEMGADDYIPKPFEKTILRARITNILNKRISYKKERELLEKTLVGSVRILSEILETLDPIIFTKISRLKKHCSFLNTELSEKVDRWILEMSAHYSLLGCVYLPKDFVLKAIHGKLLAAEERKTFELQTQYGYKILSKIPRLEVIAENIRFMFKNADGTGTPNEVSLKPEEIPLGAKILRAAWEYDVLYLKYDNPEDILSSIKSLSDRIDP
ncbi:MAG: response regulator, partial [Leptospiraceae bacterium]|nr:response regulator [Leptospiraceae bacterium]